MLAEATAPCYDQLLRAVDGIAAPPFGAIAWLRSSLMPTAAPGRSVEPPIFAETRPFDFVDAATRALPILAALPPPPPEQALQCCESVLTAAIASVLNGPRESRAMSADARFAAAVFSELGGIVLTGMSPKAMARADRLSIQTGVDRCEAQRTLLGLDQRDICRRLADSWGLNRASMGYDFAGIGGRHVSSACGALCPKDTAGRYVSDRLAGLISDERNQLDDQVRLRMDVIRASLDLAEFARRWSVGGLNWNDVYADMTAVEAGQSAFITRNFAQALAEHLDRLSMTASAAVCCRSTAAWFRGATDSAAVICAVRSADGLSVATDRLILSPRSVVGNGIESQRLLRGRVLDELHHGVRSTGTRATRTAGFLNLGRSHCGLIARMVTDDSLAWGLHQASDRIGRQLLADAGIGADQPVWVLRFGAPEELRGIIALAGPSPRSIDGVMQQSRVTAALLRRTYESVSARQSTRRRVNSADHPLNQRQDDAVRTGVTASQILARLAAGAAHELNNPLSVISGRAQMLLNNTAEGDDARALRTIHEQALRASDLVNELIETAKPAAPDPEPIRLADWVERMRQYWCGMAGNANESFDARLANPGVRIWADPDQIDAVTEAILDNARQYAKSENVHLSINSTSAESDETIILSVSDDGLGMTPETAAHAFDPFYSQREAGRGRGLGLTRALRLVEVNGGRLWIESSRGVGTTVHIALASLASRPRTHRRNS